MNIIPWAILLASLLTVPPARSNPPSQTPQQAIAAIEAVGGQVEGGRDPKERPVVGVVLGPRCRDADAALRELQWLPHVQRLQIQNAAVSQAGMNALSKATQLQQLMLFDVSLKDSEVSSLRGLHGLWQLTLQNTGITSRGLEPLQKLTGLTELYLFEPGITDTGMGSIQKLTQLHRLVLAGTKVGDPGVRMLTGLRELQDLVLVDTRVTAEGLKALRELPQLRMLAVSDKQLTPTGIVQIKALPKLTAVEATLRHHVDATLTRLQALSKLPVLVLDLNMSDVTDAQLAHLKDLPNVTTLGLSFTHITDAGLVHLAGLSRLRLLMLMYVPITDAGLKHLLGLKHLQSLWLTGTRVTPAGVAEFKKALPGSEIRGPEEMPGRAEPKADLSKAGGTVLIYEIANPRTLPAHYDPEFLVARLKRLLDPEGRGQIMIKSLGKTRVEIAVPGTGEEHQRLVQHIKDQILECGTLEFRMVANARDDARAFLVAREYFATAADNRDRQNALAQAARHGEPPPSPPSPNGTGFKTALGRFTYRWVELGAEERHELKLGNAAVEDPEHNGNWLLAAYGRHQGQPVVLRALGDALLYSRTCQDKHLSKRARADKQFDYFVLCRDPQKGKQITGALLEKVGPIIDQSGRPGVLMHFNEEGGKRIHELTAKQSSVDKRDQPPAYVAIILDGRVLMSMWVRAPFDRNAQIIGGLTIGQVQHLVTQLRAGMLPVELKPLPVMEVNVPRK